MKERKNKEFDYNVYATDGLINIMKTWKDDLEALDEELYQNRDPKKYKPHDSRCRKLKTQLGVIKFKRRRYLNLSAKSRKDRYCYLLDEKLGLKKRQRIHDSYKLAIKDEMGNGLKYREIANKFPLAKLSMTTISHIFNEPSSESVFKNLEKVKLEKGQRLYINIDDGHIKVRVNGIVFDQTIRIFSFFTGRCKVSIKHHHDFKPKKERYCLKDKRIGFILLDNEEINTEKTTLIIQEYALKFYDNFEESQLTLGGDGETWIRKVAKNLKADFVLDKFHAVKYLRNVFIVGRKKFKKKNHLLFKTAVSYFENGMYDELLKILKPYASKSMFHYFENNQEGIENYQKSWNIGVSAESDVSHLLKESLGYSQRVYNRNLSKMILTRRANWFNLGHGFNNAYNY